MRLYVVEINWDDWDELSPDFTRRHVILLGCRKYKVSLPILPLTILFDYTIQMISRILMHPILVDTKERVVFWLEADPGVFSVIYRWVEFSKSTWGYSRRFYGLTRASSIREFCKDGWVPCSNKTAIFFWFSVGVVFLSYIGLSSSGLVKISVCWVISLISTSATLCIYLSSRI